MTQDEIIRMAREAGFTDIEATALEYFYQVAFAAGAAHERKKLAEQEPVSMFEWQNGNPVGLRKAAHEREKQAEQEPVAWMQDRNDLYVADQRDKYYTVPLYAAPVCTKDLTDDEIRDVVSHPMTMMKLNDARAVIAAYKEKNK